jgi:adenosylmethionine-8-amino-7-oxononanoate aminotransferase
MAPSRSPDDEDETLIESTNDSDPSLTSYVFHGNLNRLRPLLVSQSGIYLELAGGIRILDAAMGAGVAGLGYCNTRLRKALFQQYDKIDYCNSIAYRTEICETYCKALIESTDWKMSMACVYGGSGMHR